MIEQSEQIISLLHSRPHALGSQLYLTAYATCLVTFLPQLIQDARTFENAPARVTVKSPVRNEDVIIRFLGQVLGISLGHLAWASTQVGRHPQTNVQLVINVHAQTIISRKRL